MSCPKNLRRAKAKRRRSYEVAVQRKIDNYTRMMMRMCDKLFAAQQDAKVEKERADSIEAATFALLHSRLVIKAVDHNYNKKVVVVYNHPDRVHPVENFRDLSVVLAESTPTYESQRDIRVHVKPFSVGVDADIEFFLAREHPHMMRRVIKCTDHLGMMIGRLVLKQLMDQAVVEANKV